MSKLPVVIINTEANDDWMKSLPGYQDEVAIHDQLAKEYAAEDKTVTVKAKVTKKT